MTPARIDFTLYQGATFSQLLTWQYRENDALVPVDLTGCSARMQIRRRINSNQVELDLEAEGMISIADPESGHIRIEIPSETTAALAFRSAVYDIEIEFPDGVVYRFAGGAIRLNPEVTRPQP